MNNLQHKKQKTLFQSVYGGKSKNIGGPLFFLIVGILSFISGWIIWHLGINFPFGIIEETESLRPNISFPIFDIIFILLLISSIVGTFLGLIGLVWYFFLQEKQKIV